jgi:hypothetical protein
MRSKKEADKLRGAPYLLKRKKRESNLYHATVDSQLDAGNEAAVVRGQEKRRLCDFIDAADAAQRNQLRYTCFELRHPLVVQARFAKDRRVAGARAQGVDADFALLAPGDDCDFSCLICS